ncbi:MAG: hypothetical protein U0835_25955, partial [Isosphaeraceae bacterium]
PAYLSALREAYLAAAKSADAQGKADEAEEYRENLAILERKPAASTAPKPAEAPAVAVEPRPLPSTPPTDRVSLGSAKLDRDVVRAVEGAAEPPPQAKVEPLPSPTEVPPIARPLAAPESPTAPGTIRPAADRPVEVSPFQDAPDETKPTIPMPAPAARRPPAAPEPTVGAADAAFVAQRYDEAGKIYAALDRAKKLPADRRDHWAYCRAVVIARRINARPASKQEWAAIDAEINQIRALSPKNWFGEYLRNRAAERNVGARAGRTLRSNKVVVRGSSPEEELLLPVEPTPSPAPAEPSPNGAPAGTPFAWSKSPVDSENFRVVFPEGRRALAEQVARGAEAARTSSLKRWGDPSAGRPWSPRCEILLFPTGVEFNQATGQPADSPGFSTMGMNGGQIVFRRVNLRVDHPNLVKAILPHEVTHVVLADLFPHKQIPRWADEGMAVLSEPVSEQKVRAADLDEPLQSGRLFKIGDLMGMDYPDARFWSLYYAQSVSLTRFLVEKESPEQFVRFVKEAQRTDFESAVRQVYRIESLSDLQDEWMNYARNQAAREIAASTPSSPPSTARR